MHSDPAPLEATWCGQVATTMDALILFEACLQGRINHLSRRPYDRERLGLIQSGNVFIYEEYASGIKRWTDGRHWSPSRVLGNFLVYRELRTAFQPGMTRKVMRPRRTPYSERRGSGDGQSDAEYALIGPLVDSYPFKPGGLVKKIIRVVLNGVPHHLVAYYTLEDVESGRLRRPSWDSTFCNIIPRAGLVYQEGFRVPVDQEKDVLTESAELYPEYVALGPHDSLASAGSGVLDMAYNPFHDAASSRRPSLAELPLAEVPLGHKAGPGDLVPADNFSSGNFYNYANLQGIANMHPSASHPITEIGPSPTYYPIMTPPSVVKPPSLHSSFSCPSHQEPVDHKPAYETEDVLSTAQQNGALNPMAGIHVPTDVSGYVYNGLPSPEYNDLQSPHGNHVLDLGFTVTVG